jgi:hypothetical protein
VLPGLLVALAARADAALLAGHPACSTVLNIAVTLCTVDARNTALSWFRKNWCLRFDVFCAHIETHALLSSEQVLSARRCGIWRRACVGHDHRTVGASLDHFVGIICLGGDLLEHAMWVDMTQASG